MLHSNSNSANAVNHMSSENANNCAPLANRQTDGSYETMNFSSSQPIPSVQSSNKPAKKSNVHDSFFNETLELSQEEIQKTLSANMPLTTGSSAAVGYVAEPIGQEINPMDFINNCCDEGEFVEIIWMLLFFN